MQVEAAATCITNSVVRASHAIPLRAGDRGEYILTCKDEVRATLPQRDTPISGSVRRIKEPTRFVYCYFDAVRQHAPRTFDIR